MRDTPRSTIHLDGRHSPARAISPWLLRVARHGQPRRARRQGPREPQLYDDALRWLVASDRIVSDEAALALLEVKEGKLYVREGHSRWSTYLRAFVPMTARWCQQEMRRLRALRDYPLLAAAWASGVLGKSHLRVVLRAVKPETEEVWLQRASRGTARELEELASAARDVDGGLESGRVTKGLGTASPDQDAVGLGAAEQHHVCSAAVAEQEDARSTRRIVMAPPGVAALVSEAVDVARRMAGYQTGIGAAVEMMAMEMMAGLNECPIPPDSPSRVTMAHGVHPPPAGETPEATPEEPAREQVPCDGRPGGCCGQTPRKVSLGDHLDLRREMGPGWEHIHRQMEAATGRWSDLPSDLRDVLLHGTPAEDASAHERVVFWAGLQGRLDAVRGRLLRIVEEGSLANSLGFAGFGQYVRERMGLSLRDAHELVRLDRALERLPVAFRMYASGRLGRRAAWLVCRVASSRADRAWTRFAMTHTLRLLEVVAEAALLKREADPAGWERDGGLPPLDTTFAEAIRACSHFKHVEPGSEATARVEFLLDAEQMACYEATLERLRETAHAHFEGHHADAVGGLDSPEWWGLAVMAQYFLNCYGGEDRLASSVRLRRMFHRRIIERDNYTCRAPECMQRGGLEADHIRLRSQGGPTTHANMVSLCVADHRFLKHTAGTLALSGEAPDRVTVRMGSRVYFNDSLIEPALNEVDLDSDPWTSIQDAALPWKPGSVSTGHLAVS